MHVTPPYQLGPLCVVKSTPINDSLRKLFNLHGTYKQIKHLFQFYLNAVVIVL